MGDTCIEKKRKPVDHLSQKVQFPTPVPLNAVQRLHENNNPGESIAPFTCLFLRRARLYTVSIPSALSRRPDFRRCRSPFSANSRVWMEKKKQSGQLHGERIGGSEVLLGQ